MRLIRQFFEFLEKLVRMKKNKKDEEVQVFLSGMYEKFLKHPKSYYYELSCEEIIQSFDIDTREYYIEMLAELFYQDALIKDNDAELLVKSLALFEYLIANSLTYSFNRHQRVMEIKDLLELHIN